MPQHNRAKKRKLQSLSDAIVHCSLEKKEKADVSDANNVRKRCFDFTRMKQTEEMEKALNNPRIADRYFVGDVLHQGKHEIVYDAWDQQLNIPVAVKLVKAGKVRRASEEFQYKPMEVYLYQKICHPNVLALHRCFKASDDYTAFIIERPFGYIPLKHFINLRGGTLSEPTSKLIYKTIAKTMIACLQNGVYHQKVTLENVLINPITLDCKIKDFNHAVEVKQDGHLKIFANLSTPPPEYGRVRRWVESLKAQGHSYQDIYDDKEQHKVLHADKAVSWACGVLFYQMVTGLNVRSKDNQRYSVDSTKGSQGFQEVLDKILEFNPKKRLSLEEALQLPYFK